MKKMRAIHIGIAVSSLIGLVLARPMHAATFVVPEDGVLVRDADAIVEGTCIGSWTRASTGGQIETVYQIAVDESLAGEVAGSTIEIVEPGGRVARGWLVVPGAPRYVPGERYLVLLARRDDGRWSTLGLTLGRFRFERGDRGEELLLRDAAEIHGWDASGAPHRERIRSARPFIEFIRDASANRPRRATYFVADPPAGDEPHARIAHAATAELTPGRRFTFELAEYPARLSERRIEWRIAGAADGLDLRGAAETGVAAWSGIDGSAVDYRISTASASGDTWGDDGENRIIAGDPHGQVQGMFGTNSTVLAASFVGCTDCLAIEHNGEPFYGITFADIILNDGVSPANLTREKLATAITHELGHTLGFRHSNQPPGAASCGEAVPCTRNSVMSSSVVAGLDGTLRTWDRLAVLSVYGEGPGCAPAILDEPAERLELDRGNRASLSINVYSNAPVTYQWYEGTPGDTAFPVPGATSMTLTTPPVESSTSFWVRASSDCGSVDSRATRVVTNPGRTRAVRRR